MKKLFIILLLLIAGIGIASANIIITPPQQELTVYKGIQSSQTLSVFNNNTFNIYNVTFTPTTNFNFPIITNLAPMETRQITYTILTNEVFTSSFIPTISYLYTIAYNGTPKTHQVNTSSLAFQPERITIEQNDTILWNNPLSMAITVKDLSTGFTQVDLPAFSQKIVQYSNLANYTYYAQPLGYTGYLTIIPRNMITYAHNSADDITISITLHSVLNPSTLQLNALTNNFTSNNNQTQTGILEVKNIENVMLYNISLSADWINFTENNFNLNPLSNKLILFNLTPIVTRAIDTNKTYTITINATSTNAGNTSTTISVFIPYENLDVVTINGTQYYISVLGINETIDACIQHFGESGFESCQKLYDAFARNVTVIKEIPAMCSLTEQSILDKDKKSNDALDGQQITLNKANIVLDEITNLNNATSVNAKDITEMRAEQKAEKINHENKLKTFRAWFWTVIIMTIIILSFIGVSNLIEWSEEYELEKARLQVNT